MRRPRHKIKRFTKPPTTRRWCVKCEKETTFEYNSGRGHSECIECGCFDATKLLKDE